MTARVCRRSGYPLIGCLGCVPPHVTRLDIADPKEGSGECKVCSLVDSIEVLTL